MPKSYYTVERLVVYSLIAFVVLMLCLAVIIDDIKHTEYENYKLEKLK